MPGFHVFHDVLDMQLVDREGEKIGRVDELLLELRDGAPPRVSAILVGSALRAERIGSWVASLSRATRRLLRMSPSAVTRIDFEKVQKIADQVQVEVKGMELPHMVAERRLRKVVRRIPRAGKGEGQEQK